MHPNLSLTTSFPPHHPSTLPNNRLPTSTTTSPASSSSPTASASASSPFSFSPSFRPFNSHSHPARGASPSSSGSRSEGSRSTSPLRLSTLLLRRRPSKIDLALSAERTRCDGDAIERQGLELMEPRPVDPVDYTVPMDGSLGIFAAAPASLEGVGGRSRSRSSLQSQNQIHQCDSQRGFVRPRFVMGGIFEVMEGSD